MAGINMAVLSSPLRLGSLTSSANFISSNNSRSTSLCAIKCESCNNPSPSVDTSNKSLSVPEPRVFGQCVATALAVVVLGSSYQAHADLNKFEADMRGEFGIGSAVQLARLI